MTTTGRLAGKVALITGAARGQGRSHAIALAAAGADIVAFDLCGDVETVPYGLGTDEDLGQTVKAVEATGRRVVPITGDIRSSEALDSAVQSAVDELGGLDVLVANAGVWDLGPLWELTDEQWQNMIDINLTGTWRTLKAVVPTMIEQHHGSIVITSSVNGFEAGAGMTHYVAAKHGVLGLARNAAIELGPHNIRVNVVAPGIVDTQMNDWQGAYDMMAGSPGGTPHDRQVAAHNWSALAGRGLLRVEGVSKAVVFLASDDAEDITGVVLPVDGGHAVLPGSNPSPVDVPEYP